ncbi:hypothetical protein HJC23_003113 [Cyclotella cryptica]|uniref:Uncharacterized protein n=1 Tax=Cyclotella cryptica TaxID=29204 RepID=A0ABD3NUU4_9STRA|eukprot:CCRYP_019845-RA/>CCRYP_019845-RA protein AED:0.03 eAED:0.03 QI:333/1/1/1/0/0/3/424/1112
MACFDLRIDRDREMDDDIHPIYNYLKRRGWSDALELLSCTNSKLPNDFMFDEDNADPFKITIRPIEHPTELFVAIQQRDWGAALNCLHRKPAEARTWVYRETDFPENEMLWKLLPLHASIALGAPAYFILELLDAYPDAAKKRDLKKSLPIHLVASRVDIDVDGERLLQHLLRVFPESAGVVNGRGKLPIELAYGAQLRKDKNNKVHSWCIDTKDIEDEGFELQLEMRDVMESFKSDNKIPYPPTWAVPGPTNSSGSYSSRSEATFDIIAYPFLASTYAKLGTIPESNSKAATPVSSSSSSSSSTDEKKTLGFHSIHLNNDSQPSSSSISLRPTIDSSMRSFCFSRKSARSSSSLAVSKLRLLLSRSRSLERMKSASGSDSVNNGDSESRTKTESNDLDTVISSSESKTSGEELHQQIDCLQSRSYELPRKPVMYSSPAMSLPLPSMMSGSHFSSKEKKSSTGCTSCDKDSDDTGESLVASIDLQKSLFGLLKSGQPQPQPPNVYEHAQSFDIPTKQSMYSSPARSLPSQLRMITSLTRSRNQSDECNAFGKVSSGGERRQQTDSDSTNLDVSSSKNCTSKQQRFVKKKSHSFDLPPTQSMYCSPSRSLPYPLRIFKSRSRRTDEKASNNIRCCSFVNDSQSGNAEKSCKSVDLKHSLSVSLEPKWVENHQQVYKETRSFDIPAKQTMYSSPARSLPSGFCVYKSNSVFLDKTESNANCVPFVRDATSYDEETPASKGLNDSISQLLKPKGSEQHLNAGKHSRSFDVPHAQAMYSFPTSSLPSPLRMLKLHIQPNEESNWSKNFDKQSSGESYTTHSESIQLKKSSSASLTSTPLQVDTHSLDLSVELPTLSCSVTSFPSASSLPELNSHRMQKITRMDCQSSETGPRSKSHMIAEEHAAYVDLDTTSKSSQCSESKHGCNSYRETHSFNLPPNQSMYSSPARSLPVYTTRANIKCGFDKDNTRSCSAVTGNHFIHATESGECECSPLGVVMSNHCDENQAEDMASASVEEDPVLVDFIEEAISNIGRERYEIEYVLKEMHDRRIDKIDDLLNVDSKVLAASFADKELAMEMKRLLDEPEFVSSFYENYAEEDFLCCSSGAGSHSHPEVSFT